MKLTSGPGFTTY